MNKEIKKVSENIGFLYLLKISTYIFPLITLPYLLRVIGPENYGLITFGVAFTAYFNLIVDYSFNLNGTKRVSQANNDFQRINIIFNSIYATKLFLLMMGLLLLTIIINSFPRFQEYQMLFYFYYLTVLGQALMPIWLFQGLQSMKNITYFTLIAKTIFTISIFIFIKEEDDFILVPLISGSGMIVAGLFSLLYSLNKYPISFDFPKFEKIFDELKSGAHLFTSTIYVSLYTNTSIIILGLNVSNADLGLFGASNRIVQALKSLYSPINQAIFPFFSKTLFNERKKAVRNLYKAGMITSLIFFMLGLVVFTFSESIISTLFGIQFLESHIYLKIMSFIPFLVVCSNFFGVQLLVNLGFESLFSKILLFCSLIALFLSFIFIPIYYAYANAIILVFIEFIVAIIMFLFARKLIRDV